MAASKVALVLSRGERVLVPAAFRGGEPKPETITSSQKLVELGRYLFGVPVGKDRMSDETTVHRFIGLRAQGWTYARLMAELNVSKPTLIAWSRKHQFQIQNLKAIELEALSEKWLASVTVRVNSLGAQLQQVEAELARRNLTELRTPQLFVLARQLRRQIERVTGPVQFTSPVGEIPSAEYHEQVQQWTA